ncbi:DUF1559 domain-containing protein [Telmatocola sphagniphila]|uniref:DUF1559 domain-containing protein n=1 Tax=Telmatocola sphagniphila TaxID=1123043 RepID=A0A8E6B8V0_9BACT|nr:DUF1559 domain-containing protein [Telmatocola sphagniphila]QVL34290.1 DUF1559 domain-containing protein [Telmatocola sphagniphila]
MLIIRKAIEISSPKYSKNNCSAYSMIELLVVISIISISISLVLAAVQNVRAAAARTRCGNNLRQIGLALQQYELSYGWLPMGVAYQNGKAPQLSITWMTRLLPYVDQNSLWLQALAAFQQNSFFETPPHFPILSKNMPLFVCPSDFQAQSPYNSGIFSVALTSYLGSEGTNLISKDGVLFVDSSIKLIEITDGISNTLAVGERPPSADKTLGWWYAGWGQVLGNTPTGSCDSVLGVRELQVTPHYSNCSPGPYSFRFGSLNNDCDAFHFWSLHPGGGNFVFCDGSVHFLTYATDSILPALATRSGAEILDSIE